MKFNPKKIQKFWKWVILGGIGVALTSSILAVDLSGIPTDYLLKVPKEEILKYEIEGDIVKYYFQGEIVTADENEIIAKRTANARFYKTENPNKTSATFSVGNPLYKNPNGEWRKLMKATTTLEYFNAQIGRGLISIAWADILVATSTDDIDVAWTGAAWSRNTASSRQRVGYSTVTDLKIGGGMKFNGVNIPAGSTISAATLTLVANDSDNVNTVNSVILGELDATAATFGTLADYQARRGTVVGGATDLQHTVASTTWNSIAAWTAGTSYTSPDFSAVLQEMVNTSGALTDIVIFWDDHAGNSSAINGARRRGSAWDNVTYNPPSLHFEYTTPGGEVNPEINLNQVIDE